MDATCMRSLFFASLAALAWACGSGESEASGSGDCAGLCSHLAAAGESAHCGAKLDEMTCLTWCE